MNSNEDLTKEIGRLLELARKNPAFKLRSLKSQATKAIHTYNQDRDTKRDAYVIGKDYEEHESDFFDISLAKSQRNNEHELQRQRATKEWSADHE